MSIQTEINARTAKLRTILANSNTAITSKNGTGATDLDGLPEAIATIPESTVITPTLQVKGVTPTGSIITVRPDSGYDGLSAVNVAGDTNLKAANIAEGVTIYGVTGTFEGGGSAIPEPYASYIAEAEEVYTGEYVNVIYAEGYGEHTGTTYHTVMFLLDNWQITDYDAATTEYTHSGCYIVQKEDEGEWVLSDYSTATAEEHYAKNIKAASFYVEYEGMTLFPVGIGSYPDTTAIDYSAWDSGKFTETLETGDTLEYAVEFDADGQPNKITAPDGTVTWVEWGES